MSYIWDIQNITISHICILLTLSSFDSVAVPGAGFVFGSKALVSTRCSPLSTSCSLNVSKALIHTLLLLMSRHQNNWFLFQQKLTHILSYPYIAAGKQLKNWHLKQRAKDKYQPSLPKN